MVSLDWLYSHWLDLLQSAGIIGSLLFSGIALLMDARHRRIQNLLTITKHHREIWSELLVRPELGRILDAGADLSRNPVTRSEELFVRFLVLHLKSTFRAHQAGLYAQPEGLAGDIRAFFSLPVPRDVWIKGRSIQDREFREYVDIYLESPTSKPCR